MATNNKEKTLSLKLIEGYHDFKGYGQSLCLLGHINDEQAREIDQYSLEIMVLDSAFEKYKKGEISYIELLGLYSEIKGGDAACYHWWEI